MKYDWILFDLDETLLSFMPREALSHVFRQFSDTLTDDIFEQYETKNLSLWKAYQEGKISIETLKHERFLLLGERFKTHPLELNQRFLDAVTHVSTPLPGAIDLLEKLNGKVRLGIITNGITNTQKERVLKNNIQHHFEFMVTSQEVGVAKPNPKIFDHAFELMNHPSKEKILMVGDNLSSDIQGGINAGIHTCWINDGKKPHSKIIKPHYEIVSLEVFEKVL